MTIIHKEKYDLKFGDISTSEIFAYRNSYGDRDIYMKVIGSKEYNAVSLDDGMLVYFENNENVGAVNFALVEDYKE